MDGATFSMPSPDGSGGDIEGSSQLLLIE